MKIAIVLGRGIEGVGNTKCAIELQKFLTKNNIENKIFASSDRIWDRKKSMDFDYTEFSCLTEELSIEIRNKLNSYNKIIYLSIPPKKLDEKIIENFFNYVIKQPTPQKILIQVDHNTQSLIRNAKIIEICQEMDLIFAHSKIGNFRRLLDKNGLDKEINTFVLGFDYEEHKTKYSNTNKKLNAIKFIGRSAEWKGPSLLIDFHKNKLDNSWEVTMEGMEFSFSALRILFNNKIRSGGLKNNLLDCASGKNCKISSNIFDYDSITNNEKIYLLGAYKHHDCMKRLAKCGFGVELYNLKEHMYGYSIENCHAEIVASGCVPIFHKHFGMYCKNMITDKPHYDVNRTYYENCFNTGTIWLDKDNYKEAYELLKILSKHKKLHAIFKEKAYEYWKNCTDSSITYKNFLNKLK